VKPFFAWLLIAAASFGSLAGGYHLYLSEHPRRVLIVLDASYPMQADWRAIPGVLKPISTQPYTEFSLYTEKSKVHGWTSTVAYERVNPFAPRDLSKLEDMQGEREFYEADRIIFVTNAGAGDLAGFGNWELVRPGS
jgi:hypothetical protein